MRIETNVIDGVSFINLENNSGMQVKLCTFGASFYDIKILDKVGNVESVLLTPSDLNDFYYSSGYYGKSVGRFSGRIDKGICQINNKEYKLDINWNDVNSLHGGFKGISFVNFDYEIIESINYVDVLFTYTELASQLPGDVTYKFTYRIMNDINEIKLTFEAETTEDTIVNLTNHAYFNLSGNSKRTVLDHQMQFLCDKYTRLNNELITISVDAVNEVTDFRKMHPVGQYINDDSLQNHIAKGYDHCFLKEDVKNPLVAVLFDEMTGRKLSVYTSYPAVVCYAGCYPNTFDFNEDRIKILKHHSVCLECQYVPNGINMDGVDKAILRKGEKYNHYITYKFDVE